MPVDCTAGDARAAAYDSLGLAKFRSALATVATKPVDVLFVGDSISDGWRASSDATRFQGLLRQELQHAYDPPGVPGGEGYIPLWHYGLGGTSALPQRWQTGALDPKDPPPKFVESTFGLGYRAGLLGGSQFAQITIDSDRFWVLYSQGPTVGDLGVAVDGGPVRVVHTNAATIESGRVFDSGPLRRGSHTVRVTALPVAGGSPLVVLDGLMVFDGDGGETPGGGRGVRTWDGALAGSTAAFWAQTPTWDLTNETVDPKLIIIGLGINDASSYRDPAKFEASLRAVVEKYRLGTTATPPAPDASILLWIEPRAAPVPEADWTADVEAEYSVAQTEGIGIVDLFQRLGGVVDGEFFADDRHPTDAGHRMIADALGQALGAVSCAPIRGLIRDPAGRPVSDECIIAVSASSGAPLSYARSGTDGRYEIWTTPGKYKLRTWDCGQLGYRSTWYGGAGIGAAKTVPGGASGLVDVVTR